MSELYGLSHSMWNCKIPCRVRASGDAKPFSSWRVGILGRSFHALARQEECQIIEGHLMPDHVHMCIAIPPKHPVASVVGFLKGKSAIA